jgi:hypothetical protein
MALEIDKPSRRHAHSVPKKKKKKKKTPVGVD